jgi:poly-gamma-glutamate synthesis protein (capsule biosynthesis protein)
LDYGDAGLNKTVECCQKWEIDVVGVGANLQDAEKVLYVEENGKKLAIINCCEHEFSIASRTTAGANPLNPIAQFYKIKEAKQNADFVLVVVHGGHEHFQLPSMRMQETYRFFVDAGADAVVNHHQHCYSGYEFYKEKPIFYGLGNFCFDWDGIPSKKWTEGYMVRIIFDAKIIFELIPYRQYASLNKVLLLKADSFNSELDKLNKIIGDETKLNFECERYFLESYPTIKFFLNPIRNKLISFLHQKKLFPSLINKNWLMVLLAIVRCESWRDKLVYYLNKESK